MKYRFDNEKDPPDLLVEPNFDDERTLISARRVVPLEKIEAKVRHRRQWFLGGAFAIAMMLGAASALLASYLKMRNVQKAAVAVTQESLPGDVPATSEAVAQTENPPVETTVAAEETLGEETPLATNATDELAPADAAPKKQPVKRRTAAVPKPDDYVSDPSDNRRISEEDELHRIREAVLYDEWQERRERRATRRERRRAERYNHRDLSNLDEIFEGRRRPNP